MNIHVSNLESKVTSEELQRLFEAFGSVTSAEVVKDAFTEQSRGFGYVEMSSEDEARAAIAGLDKKEVNGRALAIKEAPPKEIHRGSYKVGNGAVNVYRFKKN